MLLESFLHQRSTFVTLTYAAVPGAFSHGGRDWPAGSVNPRDLVLFLKRLRFRIRPVPVRYFGCGEYGEETWRPHYHLALFGIGREATPDVQEAWGLGHVYLGDLTAKSAAYIAGYVTKKMTAQDDERLQGRFPEFARMSRRPGIGSDAVAAIAESLNDREGCKQIGRLGDVVASLRHGGKQMPLGRYLKDKLREALGYEKGLPEGKLLEWLQEMSTVQEAAVRAGTSYRRQLVETQAILNAETKARIWAKKGQL